MFHGDCFVRDMPPSFDSVNRKRFDAIDRGAYHKGFG
jgi:hypothetical protein